MQNNHEKGFQNNPYINQQQTVNNTQMQPQGMNNSMTQTTQNPYYNQVNTQQPSTIDSFYNSFDTGNFLKGALIGAVGAYLLTNENAQKTIFKTVAKAGDMFGAGMEEMKERMEDAKAELEAEKEAKA